jgi:hypothetical protein
MTPATTDAATTDTTTSVERYLACMAAHDWHGLAASVVAEVMQQSS